MHRISSSKNNAAVYDLWLIGSVLALIAFGLLMVASSSMAISGKQYGTPFHYLFRQMVFSGVGIALATVVLRIPVALWERFSGSLFVLALLLLVAVLIPGVGRVVNGSRRWISLGIISLQVSEVVKFCFILYLASYIARYREPLSQKFLGFLKPIILLGLIGILLLLEPDFGALAVLSLTVLMVLFLAGVRLIPFVGLLVFMSLVMSLLAVLSPYRLMRITTFLNPWHHAFDSGYQLTQSLIAFGRGGFFGVGLGNSIQKLFYLPEAHTDFIFAVIAEELGLLGEFLLIALFFVVVFRIFKIARRAESVSAVFSSFVCYGCGLWLGLQALVNICVNAGVLPTKGLTLPFVSYGGSSLLVNCVLVAVVIRISHEIPMTTSKGVSVHKWRSL